MMFQDQFRFLSNFVCKNPIVFQGKEWPTVEHSYVAYKTLDKNKREEIRLTKNPGEVKRLGRKLELRKDWGFIKLHLMFKLVKLKFKANPEYFVMLKEIDGHIEESNLWHDNFWGDCKCNKCSTILGENQLGKILMYIRDKGK